MLLTRASLPEQRRPLLRLLLQEQRLLQAIECHDPLSAMLGCSASYGEGAQAKGFDLLWGSGFAHASSMGLPDAGMAILERRVEFIASVAAVTSKAILVDADTGGDALALASLCRRLEQIGASGVVVEDKAGAKRTSLASDVRHELEDPGAFVRKLAQAKESLLTPEFMIFARIESLIAGAGVEDALLRAERYLRSSADGIVIHSKDRSAAEVFAFMQGYRRRQEVLGVAKPLVCIPTAYPHVTGSQLREAGASIVIHGNHMVRAAYRGMHLAARSILKNDRALEADAVCAPVDELLESLGVDARAVSKAQPVVALRRSVSE